MKPLRTIRRWLRGTHASTEAAKPEKVAKEPTASKKFARKYYSQEGEDCILRVLFREKKTGFYVDVGAHHPYRYSNTAIFYERGWSGLNIDATPGSMTLFNEHRPRDVNIEAAVSDENQRLTYYIFDEPALNTFDAEYSSQILQIEGSPYLLKEKVEMKTVTLASLLERHLPTKQKIDFMSVDVECHDLEVLKVKQLGVISA